MTLDVRTSLARYVVEIDPASIESVAICTSMNTPQYPTIRTRIQDTYEAVVQRLAASLKEAGKSW